MQEYYLVIKLSSLQLPNFGFPDVGSEAIVKNSVKVPMFLLVSKKKLFPLLTDLLYILDSVTTQEMLQNNV